MNLVVYRPTALLIMKKNYITIAKSLGIVLPACLMISSVEAKAVNVDNENIALIQKEKENVQESRLATNSVKDRIVLSFNSDPQTSRLQFDHTNIHTDYTVSHTNVHANNRYQNQHSDSPAKHVDHHSNSKV